MNFEISCASQNSVINQRLCWAVLCYINENKYVCMYYIIILQQFKSNMSKCPLF